MRSIPSALRRLFIVRGFIVGMLILSVGCSTLFGPDEEEEDEDSIPIVGLGTLLDASQARIGGNYFLRGNGPAWSADGKEVFYCVEYFSEPMESYVRRVDIETKSNNDVAYFHGKRIYDLSASPNGEYVICIVDSGGYGEGDQLVYVVRSPLYNDAVVLDSKVGIFTSPWYRGFQPAWSSDSRWLAFQELDSTVSVYDMTIQQLAKSIHYNGVPLCFSPDGTQLLIDPYPDTTYIQYDLIQDTTSQLTITDEIGTVLDAYWDDTGVHLIYSSTDGIWGVGGKVVGITRYSMQTGSSVSLELPITDLAEWWGYMGSSPDLSKVAMVFEDRGVYRGVYSFRQHLYLGDLKTGELQLIANSDRKDREWIGGAAFSSDGTKIAYLFGDSYASYSLYYQDL